MQKYKTTEILHTIRKGIEKIGKEPLRGRMHRSGPNLASREPAERSSAPMHTSGLVMRDTEVISSSSALVRLMGGGKARVVLSVKRTESSPSAD